ncbi:thioredoxin-dependent peroxide reductase [Raphidocelis subcapitata]|uniref:thioredoxin-dependent peroxiredoxin n=1 Tax=Raphidocelis subcapitata TaxID=307507 RepID=A0A2V0PM19_9CHLO|nr:thioredoxin-dependent peroxide reductase [Raphidocelis subcapitata]|eukprot:GBF99123.1 thioredoxin-dependent peroxide reductase [Raphidocelis subcapitata]
MRTRVAALLARSAARGAAWEPLTAIQTPLGLRAAAASAARGAAPPHARAAAAAAAAAPAGARGFAASAGSDDDAALGFEDRILYPAPKAFVGERAPDFTAPAVVDGEIKTVRLADYRGKYVVLFFYPKDFTFVCPTEIIAFSDRAKEFEALNCQVIAASTDTEETHLAGVKTPRNRGGLGYMAIPIVADTTKEVAARYGVLLERAGIALRGLFIINPEGIIQQIGINDLPIGRSVDETLRLLQAIQFHAQHGEVCPADWKPGDRTIVADPERSLDYFSGVPDHMGDEDEYKGVASIASRAEFDALVAGDKPVVVDFMAPWCGKCRMIAPLVSSLAAKHPDLVFAKVDTTKDGLSTLTDELGVKGLPAFKFYRGGKEVVDQVVGYKRKPLEEAVEKLSRA